jgi:hypothetical protein
VSRTQHNSGVTTYESEINPGAETKEIASECCLWNEQSIGSAEGAAQVKPGVKQSETPGKPFGTMEVLERATE